MSISAYMVEIQLVLQQGPQRVVVCFREPRIDVGQDAAVDEPHGERICILY